MPWDKELCATFYLAHPSLPGPRGRLLAQLEQVGVTDVSVEWSAVEQVSGRWAGVSVEVRDRALEIFRAVTLVFPDAARGGGEAAPAFWREVTEAFRLACEGLRPAAAFVTDLAGPDVDQLVADREQWLVSANPVPLLHDGFALLHLSDTWFPDLDGFLRGLPYRRIALAGGPLLVGVESD
jgi:hypothetical protein